MPSERRQHELPGDAANLRQCPTPPGDARTLITHNIPVPTCMARQRELYHKCHRCVYRGKPAGWTLDPAGALRSAVGRKDDAAPPPAQPREQPMEMAAAGRSRL